MGKHLVVIIVFSFGFFLGMVTFSDNGKKTSHDTIGDRDTTITVDTNIFINPPAIEYDIVIDETIDIPMEEIQVKDNGNLAVLPIETKKYSGPGYKLQIRGFQPELDWIETYPETKYITNSIADDRRNLVYLSGEIMYSDRFTTAAMLMYQRKWKYFQLEAGAGYDIVSNNAVVMARMKIPIFRW